MGCAVGRWWDGVGYSSLVPQRIAPHTSFARIVRHDGRKSRIEEQGSKSVVFVVLTVLTHEIEAPLEVLSVLLLCVSVLLYFTPSSAINRYTRLSRHQSLPRIC